MSGITRVWISAFCFACILIYPFVANAAHFKSQLSEAVLDELTLITPEELSHLQQLDPLILQNISGPILEADPEVALRVISTMADEKWGPMDFFANPFFNHDKRVIYYPAETLARIHKTFNFESVFFMDGTLSKAPKTQFEMQGILVGNGRIIVLYPSHVSTHRTDPLFGFLTGNYEFYKVNIVEIASEPGMPFELRNFKGRDRPTDPLRPVRGPLNVPLRRMLLTPDRNFVRVFVGPTWWTFPHPRITRKES